MGWREWFGIKPRMQDFAETLISRFARDGDFGWQFDPKECTLQNEADGVINLGNMYREYTRAKRTERHGLLEKYASMSQATQRAVPKLWTLAEKSIYPVVRSQFDLAVTAIQSRGAEKSWPAVVRWPWIGDMEVRIAYDFGHHLTQVQEAFADTWGQSHEAIRQRALLNLAALPMPTWRELGKGVFQVETATSYQESLLLVDKVVNLLPFRGSIVCLPCNRGILLAADKNNPDSLTALFEEAIRNLEEKPWPLSGTPLERIDGTWQEFRPEGEAAIRAGDLQRISFAITYADQKSLLEAHYVKNKIDIYVATYSMVRRPQDGGAIRSWCSWGEGISSSLPKTDLIMFGRKAEHGKFTPVPVAWDRAMAVVGQYVKEANESPPRYFAEATFTDAEWAALVAERQNES